VSDAIRSFVTQTKALVAMTAERDEAPATQIREDLAAILEHYDQTLEPVKGTSGSHIKVSKEPPLPISANVLDARAMCRSRLGGWVQIVLEEQRLNTTFYAGDLPALVGFLDTHADWLATFEAGRDAAYEIGLSAQELKALAMPRVKAWMKIGTCPLKVERDGEQVICGGTVQAYPDKDPKCQKCGDQGDINWWERIMFPEMGIMHRLVPTSELVVFLHKQIGRRIAEVTIRAWLNKGLIESAGKDDKGRTLYDKREVIKAFDRNGRMVGIGRHADSMA